MRAMTLAYVLPMVGMAFLAGPLVSVLSGIYAKHSGLSLTAVASVMFASKFFDAISDPIIGNYSDKIKVRTGSRKSSIIVGAIALVPCGYFLFSPPAGVGILYFAFWYIAFYFAQTLFLIPYTAWANEFTVDSKEKTFVYSCSAIAGQTGGAMFYALPLLPIFVSTDITPQILRVTVFVGAGLLLPGVILAMWLVPDGQSIQNKAVMDDSRLTLKQGLAGFVAEMLDNKPFLIFVGAYMCLGLGVGMWTGMFFIFVDSYLLMGEHFALISLWGLLVGALSIPVWYRLSLKVGKRNTWLFAMVLLAFGFLIIGFLQPGSIDFNSLFVLNILVTFAIACTGVVGYPMVCDVIDYGRLKHNTERNATYFALLTLMMKLQFAIGGSLGMAITSWYGFDLLIQDQSGPDLHGLRFSVSWGPVLFVGLALLFVVLVPLTEQRMIIIRRRLSRRTLFQQKNIDNT